ncbi:MAG: tetratricopeptide repeat protein [Pyrinomonadaceae bacterium]|nr:tetratricopeptide repeat protein [Pyrinomonadaceae bacterium]
MIWQKVSKVVALGFALSVCAGIGIGQQGQYAPFDIEHYKIDAKLSPDENRLDAVTAVKFAPLRDTRSIVFELNGSLEVKEVKMTAISTAVATSVDGPPPLKGEISNVTFVQDRVGVSEIGPNVRVDLGATVPKGSKVTLEFKYGGVMSSAQGGPLITKRLAYVGPDEGYLMYAARWFPFHEYAADRATSEILVSVPSTYQVVGASDEPVTTVNGKQRFVMKNPGLVGNLSYGRYVVKTLQYGGYELVFHTKAGVDDLVNEYAETLGSALEYYTTRFGTPAFGKKLVVAQIDDDSLEYYSQEGMLFLANRIFNGSKPIILERLQREAAMQWWGLTVGLKSFDDAWLSQGLAEYSAFSFRESKLTGAKLDSLRRELLEKSLTFEQTASLVRTPASLDDQSIAYRYIMYSKGAFVYKLLRDTMGELQFDSLLRRFLNKYREQNASIVDFENLANEVSGKNLRYFFARWVEGTGVPEFQADYLILRTRSGKFVTRGTVKQNYDNLRLPVEIQLRAEGQGRVATETIFIEDTSADFNIESDGKPIGLDIDPRFKILRISDDLRVSSIARRGIEQYKEGNYVEAQQQFEAALRLDRSNAWIYYHLGLLFLDQLNYDLAIDNFKSTRELARRGQASPTWLYVWSEIKMGNAYDAKGDRDRAVAAYKRAQQVGDTYDNAQDAAKKYLAKPFDPRATDEDATAVR